ncbi:1337_t:CDS:2, partial [Paraglomus brasilianum]
MGKRGKGNNINQSTIKVNRKKTKTLAWDRPPQRVWAILDIDVTGGAISAVNDPGTFLVSSSVMRSIRSIAFSNSLPESSAAGLHRNEYSTQLGPDRIDSCLTATGASSYNFELLPIRYNYLHETHTIPFVAAGISRKTLSSVGADQAQRAHGRLHSSEKHATVVLSVDVDASSGVALVIPKKPPPLVETEVSRGRLKWFMADENFTIQ